MCGALTAQVKEGDLVFLGLISNSLAAELEERFAPANISRNNGVTGRLPLGTYVFQLSPGQLANSALSAGVAAGDIIWSIEGKLVFGLALQEVRIYKNNGSLFIVRSLILLCLSVYSKIYEFARSCQLASPKHVNVKVLRRHDQVRHGVKYHFTAIGKSR